MDGKFAIEAAPGTELLVSSVGYSDLRFSIKEGQAEYRLVLKNDLQLEETVVVGYATQKKATLTGAVSSVLSRDIVTTKNENVQNMLTGKVAGLRVVQNSAEPGAWGGQWIRDNIKSLAQDVPNYAWSFELIVPENGLILGSGNRMLEVSFDSVMYVAGEDVVGHECYESYGDEFPIRMDYLDNFDGGNLSIQCHPHKPYIQENFGEVLTQEETYYILDCKPGAEVYLGFQDDIVPEQFESALTESFEKGTPLDVPKYINSEIAHKHDLFLIPPGTLHSSGCNNLVLEISTTPYIFTFKMYDWLALDLDGKPRPLNIRRAMDNLCFDRKGDKIKAEHVCHPVLIEKGPDWEFWHMPTHRNHSYDIHRYKINSSVDVMTDGKCHVLNLVEGESTDVVTRAGETFHLNYAETLVVSAAALSYRIINTSGREIMMVKAFMK